MVTGCGSPRRDTRIRCRQVDLPVTVPISSSLCRKAAPSLPPRDVETIDSTTPVAEHLPDEAVGIAARNCDVFIEGCQCLYSMKLANRFIPAVVVEMENAAELNQQVYASRAPEGRLATP